MPLKCNRQKGGVCGETISLHSVANNNYCIIVFSSTLLLVTKKKENPSTGSLFCMWCQNLRYILTSSIYYHIYTKKSTKISLFHCKCRAFLL